MDLIEFDEDYEIDMLQHELPGLGRVNGNKQLFLIMPSYPNEAVSIYSGDPEIKTSCRKIYVLPEKYENTTVIDFSPTGLGLILGGVDSVNNLIMIQNSATELWGWIDFAGNDVIHCKYEFATHFFRKNYSIVRIGKNRGVINKHDDFIVPLKYSEIIFVHNTDRYFICANDNGECIIYDSIKSYEIVIPFELKIYINENGTLDASDSAQFLDNKIIFHSFYHSNLPVYNFTYNHWELEM